MVTLRFPCDQTFAVSAYGAGQALLLTGTGKEHTKFGLKDHN